MYTSAERVSIGAFRQTVARTLRGEPRSIGAVGATIIGAAGCPVCQEYSGQVLADRDREGGALRTLACSGCGLLRVDPLPTDEELGNFYESEYRYRYKGVRRPRLKHVYRAGLLAAARLRRLAHLLGERARILDVGCASGEWLYVLGAAGHVAVGIEMDPAYAEFGRQEYGVRILTGSILTQPPPETRFDCVTLFHVLEHLPYPVEALHRMQSWAEDDGLLVIEVPNMLSVHQHPAQRFHYAHVVGFTPQSLVHAINKAGWECVELTLDSYDRNLFAIARRRGANQSLRAPLDPAGFSGPLAVPVVSSSAALARYYFRLSTYVRWFKRIWKFADEFRAITAARSARAALQAALHAVGHGGEAKRV